MAEGGDQVKGDRFEGGGLRTRLDVEVACGVRGQVGANFKGGIRRGASLPLSSTEKRQEASSVA